MSTIPPDDLKEHCGTDPLVNVPERPLGVSASNGLARADCPARSASMAVLSLLSPNWASTVSRKLGMCSGADPRVISGSFLACLNCSLDADEIHCASMARAPLVFWNWGRALHFPLEYRQRGRMEWVAGLEPTLEGLLGPGFVGGRIHSGPFGWESVGPFEAPFSVRLRNPLAGPGVAQVLE